MTSMTPEQVRKAFSRARQQKPAYGELYPLLEFLFVSQVESKADLSAEPIVIKPELVKTKWGEGFPLIHRWDFPIDMEATGKLFQQLRDHVPQENKPLADAYRALERALEESPEAQEEIWESFLQHEWEPWDQWVATTGVDTASLLFLARSCLRPSVEWGAEQLLARHPLPDDWNKGYCPVCGSLPGFLHLEGQGSRWAHCSWCSSRWRLHRLQCPHCDNRSHESLGYLYAEEEPLYRVHYCRLCRKYFKLIDLRELADPVYFPLEEWTTLHLDLLAQREGWEAPPSPSPTVYPSNGD